MAKGVAQVTLGFLALHLLAGAAIPLIGDESYYTLWASALDWDYYDHPPMIAAMIRAGTTLFGITPFGVRLWPLTGMAVATLIVADMARLLGGDDRVQTRAALYFNLSAVVLAVGGVATPDAPSTLFWLLSSWAAMRAASGMGRRWWLLAGFAAGLGIMSKFTNLFLGVAYVGWLISTRQGRASLKTPAPYLAVIAAALPVLPLLWWNIAHHGLGFERQFGRIAEAGFAPGHIAEYLALLLILPTPLIAILALRGLGVPLTPARNMLLWSIGPLLGYFLIHALHSAIPGNWLIPAAGTTAILAAQCAGRISPIWRRVVLVQAALISFGSLAYLALPPFADERAYQVDNPPNQTRGWPVMLAEIPTDGWIATTDYALTGQLYVRLPGRQVWSVTDLDRYGFRGAFPQALCDAPGWLIQESSADPDRAAQLFDDVGQTKVISRVSGGQTVKEYRIQSVSGLKVPALCP